MNERIQVHNKASRCPYCHAEVPVAERVVCATCLGVHHTDCWGEHGKCSACGHPKALRADPGEPEPAPRVEVEPRVAEAQAPLRPPPDIEFNLGTVVVAVVLGGVGLVAFVFYAIVVGL